MHLGTCKIFENMQIYENPNYEFESCHRKINFYPRIHAIRKSKKKKTKKNMKIINIPILDLLLLLVFYAQCNNGEHETTCRSV